MTNAQIIEVGKALLPYLRNDLSPAELGTAAHDAAAALRRAGRPSGISDVQRLTLAVEAERERCAKIAERQWRVWRANRTSDPVGMDACDDIAREIRADH